MHARSSHTRPFPRSRICCRWSNQAHWYGSMPFGRFCHALHAPTRFESAAKVPAKRNVSVLLESHGACMLLQHISLMQPLLRASSSGESWQRRNLSHDKATAKPVQAHVAGAGWTSPGRVQVVGILSHELMLGGPLHNLPAGICCGPSLSLQSCITPEPAMQQENKQKFCIPLWTCLCLAIAEI